MRQEFIPGNLHGEHFVKWSTVQFFQATNEWQKYMRWGGQGKIWEMVFFEDNFAMHVWLDWTIYLIPCVLVVGSVFGKCDRSQFHIWEYASLVYVWVSKPWCFDVVLLWICWVREWKATQQWRGQLECATTTIVYCRDSLKHQNVW